jgi:hypothetical protein
MIEAAPGSALPDQLHPYPNHATFQKATRSGKMPSIKEAAMAETIALSSAAPAVLLQRLVRSPGESC